MRQWQGMREAAKLGWGLLAGRAGEAGLFLAFRLRHQGAFLFLSLKNSSGPLALVHLSNAALKREWKEVLGEPT